MKKLRQKFWKRMKLKKTTEAYKSRGDEFQWIIKEEDYHQVKEGVVIEKNLSGEQRWCRLSFRQKEKLEE